MERFGLSFKVKTIGELCELLKYDGPVELLTMFLCFAGCPQVKAVGHVWLRKWGAHVRTALHTYKAAWHYEPIPACIIPVVAAALKQTAL